MFAGARVTQRAICAFEQPVNLSGPIVDEPRRFSGKEHPQKNGRTNQRSRHDLLFLTEGDRENLRRRVYIRLDVSSVQ
jgi:hypothetical protein